MLGTIYDNLLWKHNVCSYVCLGPPWSSPTLASLCTLELGYRAILFTWGHLRGILGQGIREILYPHLSWPNRQLALPKILSQPYLSLLCSLYSVCSSLQFLQYFIPTFNVACILKDWLPPKIYQLSTMQGKKYPLKILVSQTFYLLCICQFFITMTQGRLTL